MVVSEILSSNGSSSMGAACAASLALMDAVVPFPKHVGGIAMGLVTDEHDQGRSPVVLTDIAGMEDEGGDMDFKVAGTREGVTALQVDIKIPGLSHEIIDHALAGARTARLAIITAMERVLQGARPELSPHAPRIVTFSVKPDRIRDIIGPRGTTINKIVEQTGAEITVEDDGTVFVTAPSAQSIEKAVTWIKGLTREVVAGEEFVGRVTRLMNFGAFVELFPGTEGLVHISAFGKGFVQRIEDVAAVGDTLNVVVKEIDSQGRVNLFVKRPGEAGGEGHEPPLGSDRDSPPRRPGGAGHRGPRGGGTHRRHGAPPARRPGFRR
jgi:polyribonucleotide nucleotidyltransferase